MVQTKSFMEFIGHAFDLSAPNTLTTSEISTPVGKSENLAMLIHKIRMGINGTLDSPADGDRLVIQVTRAPKTAIVGYDDPDLLGKLNLDVAWSAGGGYVIEVQKSEEFIPPVLYAKSKLHCLAYTVGQAAATTINIQIGYTLEKVADKDFIAALSD